MQEVERSPAYSFCILQYAYTLCIPKVYRTNFIRLRWVKMFKKRYIFRNLTNLGGKYGYPALWKNLWKVCITLRMERILCCYGNHIHKMYTGKT